VSKNIIICTDGTGNEFSDKNATNVVETYLIATKSENQLVYYDPGVGTGGFHYDEGKGVLTAGFDKATGAGVHENTKQAYRFLMEVYEPGDDVYLFGFSRGAFTARSLTGMLYEVGLLEKHNENQLEYASKYYLDKEFKQFAPYFKEKFSQHCPVHFVGVWDTVVSTVLVEGEGFADARISPEVTYGYHAVSIDERRKDFPVTLWDPGSVGANQTVEQVWFSGVHSDVGGWYEERDLSSIALIWMLEHAEDAGLSLDSTELEKRRMQRKALGKINNSYTGFWKFRGSRTRIIPEDSRIHASALQRSDELAGYEFRRPTSFTVAQSKL
jgi:uncharacterized protein (DUF2235 family)